MAFASPSATPSLASAIAIGTIAHEAQHVVANDHNEASVWCHTDQLMPSQLFAAGFDPANASLLTNLFVDDTTWPDQYHSAECRPGGKLDLGLPDGVFPSQQ